MSKVKTFLWYDAKAEEAAAFYVSLIPGSKLGATMPGPNGGVLTVEFELAGVPYVGLNGGPHFKLSEAVSIAVTCETQAEVDRYWDALVAGGSPSRCGWLKDRWGLSWQIIPSAFLTAFADPARAGPVMAAMMTMSKPDVAALEAAGR